MSQRQFQANGQVVQRFLGAASLGFLIPVYQREYSWGQEDIARLFEDLDEAARDLVVDGDDLTFLGSVIVTSGDAPKGSDKPTAVYHVVDGQQRIATLLMIAARLHLELRGLYELLRAADSPLAAVAQRTAGQLKDLCVLDSKAESEPYWPRLIRVTDRWSYDASKARYNSDIARLFAAEILSKRLELPAEGSVLHNAWETIADSTEEYRVGAADGFIRELQDGWTGRVPEWIGHLPSTDEGWMAVRLVLLAKSLLERVQLIVVEAPDEDRAFSIFEPLNTTGQLLTALETIKPKVVRIEGGQDNYIGSESQKHLDAVDKVVESRDPMKKAKRSADLITVFSLAETGQKLGHKLSVQRRELDRLLKNSVVDDVRASLANLREVAQFEADMWGAKNLGRLASMGDDETWVAMAFLRDSNHSITRALFSRYHRAHRDGRTSLEDWSSLIQGVAAFWFLWRASRSTTAGIDSHYRTLMGSGWPPTTGSSQPSSRRVPPLARRLSGGDLPPVSDVLWAFRTILEEKGGVTDFESWKAATTGIGVYGGRAIQKFGLLVAHHDSTATDKPPHLADGAPNSNPVLSRRYWGDLGLTVEHVAPQSPDAADRTFESRIHSHKRLKEGWGNLTLVPQMENSVLSNRSWPEKRSIYRILGEADPDRRVEALEEINIVVSNRTKKRLKGARRMPFCESVGRWQGDRWTSAMVQQRGEALARRMWTWCASALEWGSHHP